VRRRACRAALQAAPGSRTAGKRLRPGAARGLTKEAPTSCRRAVDLAWDVVARWGTDPTLVGALPRQFYDDFVAVAEVRESVGRPDHEGSDSSNALVCARACVRPCARGRVCVCVCACVCEHKYVRVYVCVFVRVHVHTAIRGRTHRTGVRACALACATACGHACASAILRLWVRLPDDAAPGIDLLRGACHQDACCTSPADAPLMTPATARTRRATSRCWRRDYAARARATVHSLRTTGEGVAKRRMWRALHELRRVLPAVGCCLSLLCLSLPMCSVAPPSIAHASH
jgi:hypothetical protein